MSEVSMKVYEQDRSIVEQLEPFTVEEKKMVEKDLERYFLEQSSTKHFLLLSNDINYYTIFKRGRGPKSKGIAEAVLEFLEEDSFLQTLGELKVLKRTTTQGVIEIWLGTTYFLLFPADSFFVEV